MITGKIVLKHGEGEIFESLNINSDDKEFDLEIKLYKKSVKE